MQNMSRLTPAPPAPRLTPAPRCLAAAAACACVLALTGNALAEGTEFIMKGYEATATGDLVWKANAAVPPGLKMVLIYGDPKQAGPYIFRAKLPVGYKLPAHKHQDKRIVTVLQGTYWSGAGEKYDQDKLTKFTPGSFYITEPGVPHFSWAETEVIIQEMGIGPIDNPIQYVDAADDPRKK
jgi:quercetin dioxygenase-like cupin family protein